MQGIHSGKRLLENESGAEIDIPLITKTPFDSPAIFTAQCPRQAPERESQKVALIPQA
jgi:hypothetical protein